MQSNSSYSFIRYPDGREPTISNNQLAPVPTQQFDDSDSDDNYFNISNDSISKKDQSTKTSDEEIQNEKSHITEILEDSPN